MSVTVSGVGRICNDLEEREAGGHRVLEVTVAFQTGKDKTTFLPCQFWNDRIDFVTKYFEKGKPVFVTGTLEQDNWENDEGEKRSKLKVNNAQFNFVPQSKNGTGNGGDYEEGDSPAPKAKVAVKSAKKPTGRVPKPAAEEDDDESIPF